MTAKKPKPKPRRAFRAWLIHEISKRGVPLPADPTYVQLRDALDSVLRPPEGRCDG